MKASQVQILICICCQNPADEICPPTPYPLKITFFPILYKEKGKNTTEFKTVVTFNKVFQAFSIIKTKNKSIISGDGLDLPYIIIQLIIL